MVLGYGHIYKIFLNRLSHSNDTAKWIPLKPDIFRIKLSGGSSGRIDWSHIHQKLFFVKREDR